MSLQYTKPEYDYQHRYFKLDRKYIRWAQEHREMYERLHRSAAIEYEVVQTITPLKIPTVYHVHYNIRSIVGVNNESYPVYGDRHTVRLEVPPEYPLKPSIPYMVTPAWHPNIKWEGELQGRICANSVGFGRNFTLAQMAIRVGEILQWQNYLARFEAPFPEDPKVADWVLEFAEPRDIVNLDKGIYVDTTPLLKERSNEPEQGPAPTDQKPTNPQDGFSIKPRTPRSDDRSDLDLNTAADPDPSPDPKEPQDGQGGGINIRPRG